MYKQTTMTPHKITNAKTNHNQSSLMFHIHRHSLVCASSLIPMYGICWNGFRCPWMSSCFVHRHAGRWKCIRVSEATNTYCNSLHSFNCPRQRCATVWAKAIVNFATRVACSCERLCFSFKSYLGG
jgi:hypothetical protein